MYLYYSCPVVGLKSEVLVRIPAGSNICHRRGGGGLCIHTAPNCSMASDICHRCYAYTVLKTVRNAWSRIFVTGVGIYTAHTHCPKLFKGLESDNRGCAYTLLQTVQRLGIGYLPSGLCIYTAPNCSKAWNRIFANGVVHIHWSKLFKRMGCAVLSMILCMIKNPWSHSIRVGHGPNFLLSRYCHDCAESDVIFTSYKIFGEKMSDSELEYFAGYLPDIAVGVFRLSGDVWKISGDGMWKKKQCQHLKWCHRSTHTIHINILPLNMLNLTIYKKSFLFSANTQLFHLGFKKK